MCVCACVCVCWGGGVRGSELDLSATSLSRPATASSAQPSPAPRNTSWLLITEPVLPLVVQPARRTVVAHSTHHSASERAGLCTTPKGHCSQLSHPAQMRPLSCLAAVASTAAAPPAASYSGSGSILLGPACFAAAPMPWRSSPPSTVLTELRGGSDGPPTGESGAAAAVAAAATRARRRAQRPVQEHGKAGLPTVARTRGAWPTRRPANGARTVALATKRLAVSSWGCPQRSRPSPAAADRATTPPRARPAAPFSSGQRRLLQRGLEPHRCLLREEPTTHVLWDALRAADCAGRTHTARRPTSGYGGVPPAPALWPAPRDGPVALPPCGSGMHLTPKRLKHSGGRKALYD